MTGRAPPKVDVVRLRQRALILQCGGLMLGLILRMMGGRGLLEYRNKDYEVFQTCWGVFGKKSSISCQSSMNSAFDFVPDFLTLFWLLWLYIIA